MKDILLNVGVLIFKPTVTEGATDGEFVATDGHRVSFLDSLAKGDSKLSLVKGRNPYD